MSRRSTQLGLAAGGVLGIAVITTAVLSPSLRASFDAAARAFRDPSLVERKPDAPASLDCRRFESDGAALDVAIAKDFQRAKDEDLDDPDGMTLRSLALPDLPIPITRRTMRYVRFFAKTEAGRAAFQARFRRSGLYRERIEFTLREAGLPEDLVWVPAIESAFDPRSLSPSGAAGLWQFMPETGALYGLEQSEWLDERKSLTRASIAGVAHLRDLYERFHRWDLALAAYNVGFEGVVRAMDKFAQREGRRPSTFAEIAGARLLPEETASYVPQIHAFAIVAQNRAHFGLDQMELGQPTDLGELAVPAGTRLRTVARAAGLPSAVIRDLNPQVLRDRAPPTGGDYLVTLPADRVQHALATFAAYADQELVGQPDAEDAAPESSPPNALPNFPEDAPLPRRPRDLGANRLPVVASLGDAPGAGSPLATFANLSVFDAKLPMVLIGGGTGWSKDPLGVFAGEPVRGTKARDLAVEKELGFLHDAARVDDIPSFALPGGVVVRMRRDPNAIFATVTVSVASNDASRRSGTATNLTTSTLTVGKKDVDGAVELAAARARLAVGSVDADLAALRKRAGEPRRKELEAAPNGKAWLALSDALFPASHPLAGSVIGARDDGYSARESLLVDLLGEERAHAKATITVLGDFDEARARQLLTAFLGNVGTISNAMVPLVEHEEHLAIDDDVPAPRLLYGFLVPGEGESGDLSARLLVELLQNPKVGRLARRLSPGHGSIESANAEIDVGPRASVVAIEIGAALGRQDDAEKRVEAELDSLANEGPTAVEIAAAKVFLKLKLEKAKKLAEAPPPAAGAPHSTPIERLKHTLKPEAIDRALASLDEVSIKTVQALAKRHLAKDRRIVITTSPVRAGLHASSK